GDGGNRCRSPRTTRPSRVRSGPTPSPSASMSPPADAPSAPARALGRTPGEPRRARRHAASPDPELTAAQLNQPFDPRSSARRHIVASARGLWHVRADNQHAPAGPAPAALRGLSVARIVVKFGGTSVANVERIRQAARHVKREVDAGHQVAGVVSAMSGKTNELVGWVNECSPLHDAREYDAVVASGEQVTAGLMAIVLQEMGIQSRSYSGWQVPIYTDDSHGAARIAEIDPTELDRRMSDGWVPVITGFQGINKETQRITTLGRGGSDTSAVAVAAA